jgi:hypothetical protein
MTKYNISRGTFGSVAIEIDQQEFEKSRAGRNDILTMLTAEEKYDLVIENYLEFERSLLESTIDYMVLGDHDEDWFNKQRNEFDRRVFNLLSSCRSYVEFAPQCANVIDNVGDKIKKRKNEIHASSFAYRLMDNLRNFVTYGGSPTHVLTFSQDTDSMTDDFILIVSTPEISVTTERLAKAKKTSAKVLAEIEERGGNVSLCPLLREYMRHLSECHQFLRDLCRQKVETARNTAREICERYAIVQTDGPDFNGVLAIKYEGNSAVEKFWIVRNPNRLDYFERKNRALHNLERRVLTNKIPPHR